MVGSKESWCWLIIIPMELGSIIPYIYIYTANNPGFGHCSVEFQRSLKHRFISISCWLSLTWCSLWLSVFTSLVFRYCTVFMLSHDPNTVISVLKPICSPLWKLWRRLHSQPVTFTTSKLPDSHLAVVSRSSKSLDKMDLLLQTWWIIELSGFLPPSYFLGAFFLKIFWASSNQHKFR